MVAIMGAAAIEPALAAIRRGGVVALANKECVVAAGAVFYDAIERSGAQVLPVDSEHNAIFQCVVGNRSKDISRLILTASGGPFRTASAEAIRSEVKGAVKQGAKSAGRDLAEAGGESAARGIERAAADVAPVQAPVLSTYPVASQDVALVVGADVLAADVAAALQDGASEAGDGNMLEEVRLFDVYTGEQVGPGRKSLAYTLRFRAPDRTLTDEEVAVAREAAVASAERRTGAVLRGA